MRRALALLALVAGTVRADGVADLCAAEGVRGALCACAAEALAAEIAADDYALYHRIGWDYARLRARGAAEEVAWDSALAAEAARRGADAGGIRRRAEAVRRTHRAHLRYCRQRAG